METWAVLVIALIAFAPPVILLFKELQYKNDRIKELTDRLMFRDNETYLAHRERIERPPEPVLQEGRKLKSWYDVPDLEDEA
ncbi:hypothetical protein PAEVO_03750 [Paenibacillus sp. GM2FR]|uniref:hypothetical protein n=1 Tax=Paenibacillus sp. GM2FR TaxID=2059268 RepID=UPI000C280DEB|nr:hypothetical protein [Paenibacillus sp. GM2FR]PJN53654.1 hypothetical protein PAEVO_03750 [Paenibacillus sp. GM2FR]